MVPGTSSPTTPVPSTRHCERVPKRIVIPPDAPRILHFLPDFMRLLQPYEHIFELHHEVQAIGDRMSGFSSTDPACQRDEEMEADVVYRELQRRRLQLCRAMVAELDPLVTDEGVRERLAYFKREFEASLEDGVAGRD